MYKWRDLSEADRAKLLEYRQQNWPFSSAHEYIKKYGRERVMDNWLRYDCSKMGYNWDDY